MNISKKYTVYLMQHSHTDIGYTKSPEYTIIEQVEYIYQLINDFQEVLKNPNHKWKSYKWICESFIIVEKFLNEASEEDIALFIELVKLGKIEVTGMYANLSEVIDANILKNMIRKSKSTADKYGFEVKSAMNADINGLARDYAKALVDNDVTNYMSCVHTHHGMYPLFKKQQPFTWDLGDNKQLTVWLMEHYMFGNGFGFAKGAVSMHGFFDDEDYKRYNETDDDSWLEMSIRRFERYINKLEEDGYKYDFFPLTIHGKFTDNSMPNMDIAARVDLFNEQFKDQIEVKMVTLSEFFEIVSELNDLPVYSGEWPDWWTDGVISAPAQLKMFKNTQKRYLDLMEVNSDSCYSQLRNQIEHNLTMYAEHTYGSFDSITNPYHTFTHKQWMLKQNYLSTAMREVDELELKILKTEGVNNTRFEVPTKFKIINPSNYRVKKQIVLPYQDCDHLGLTGKYQITDNKNRIYGYEVTTDYRKFPILEIEVEPKETLIVEVLSVKNDKVEDAPYYGQYNLRGSDNVFDLQPIDSKYGIKKGNELHVKDLVISWNQNGINSIISKGNELLTNGGGFLQPIYELSEVNRSTLGRNRKGTDVKRSVGIVSEVKVLKQASLFTEIMVDYKVTGFDKYRIYYKVYQDGSKIECKINCDKELKSDIENVYLDIPFKKSKIEIAKAGSVTSAWEEQLPGSLLDYTSVFDGILFDEDVVLTMPDVQMLQLGSIDPQNRILMGHPEQKDIEMKPYIWLMSNYWETNFVKSLAGYYEFAFTIQLDTSAELDSYDKIKAAATDLLVFAVNE